MQTKQSEKIKLVVGLVGFALMAVALGALVLFGFSRYATYPSLIGTSLVEVRGPAHSFVRSPPPRRGNSHVSFDVEGYPGRFWTGAVSSVPDDWGQRVAIRVWVAENSSLVPTADGSIKSYGLWINGKEVVSPTTSLESERENAQMGMFFLIFVGVLATYCGFQFAAVMSALRKPPVGIHRETHGRGR